MRRSQAARAQDASSAKAARPSTMTPVVPSQLMASVRSVSEMTPSKAAWVGVPNWLM